MFENKLPVSYYEEIAQLHPGHGISIVRHRETGEICVKKVLSVYNPEVYAVLFAHPVLHTPRIYALYEENSRLTVIEEYISGDSLADILANLGYLTEWDASVCVILLCRILTALHSFRPPIIHRDIKPSNIILTETGQLVLLDMNAAKQESPEKRKDTRLLGTPGYAAPEQYGFGSSSPETDIYAAGVLLSELLAGNPAGISPELRRIMEKCRALDPAGRYPAAADLASDLEQFLRRKQSGGFPSLFNSVPHTGHAFSHRGGGNSFFFENLPLKACPVCGHRTGAREAICPECGHLFPPIPSPSPEEKKNSAKKKNSSAFLPVLCAVLLLTGVVSFASFLHSGVFRGFTPFPPQAGSPESRANELPPEDIFGSWQGNDGSGLTIYRDGTAVYYQEIDALSEPAAPWVYSDGKLTITLSKLHCSITADVPEAGFTDLTFSSESRNWKKEQFSRLPEENPAFLESALRSNDQAITVLPDGQMELSFGELTFRVPKHYLDFETPFSSDENVVILSDLDVEQAYIGSLCFQYMDFPDADLLDTELTFPGQAREYLYSFYYNVKLDEAKEEQIAGTRTFIARFTGETNRNFQGLTGIPSEGLVAFFCDAGQPKNLAVFISQSADRPVDNLEEMKQILYGAMPRKVPDEGPK